jgi:imidazolonepropionase-like amidohydrolase
MYCLSMDFSAGKRRHIFRASVFALCAGLTVSLAGRTQIPTAVVFRNVTVVPMDVERVVPAQTVVIRGSNIESVAPVAPREAAAGAVVIDGSARFLMPGLTDMHVHLPSPEAPADRTEAELFLYVSRTEWRRLEG